MVADIQAECMYCAKKAKKGMPLAWVMVDLSGLIVRNIINKLMND